MNHRFTLFTALGLLFVLMNCKPSSSERIPEPGGRLITIDRFPSAFVDSRSINILLPPGYDSTQRYPVLYMHDGQMLFDPQRTWNHQAWCVDSIMDTLVQQNKIRPAIIVGIPNNGAFRWAEYVPQVVLDALPAPVRAEVIHKWLNEKPSSDAYLTFIVQELKPYIDQHYATFSDREHTFIMGSSMGGIISLYAICSYPDIFGGAACMSSHWPLDIPGTTEDDVAFDVPGAFIDYLQHHLPPAASHRIYFDYGTATLDSLYEPYQIQVDSIMIRHGYDGQNWVTAKFPGGAHTESSWSERLPIPLTFLLGQP